MAIAAALAMAACSANESGRPETPAQLAILTPEPNTRTGSDVAVELRLDDAEVLPATEVGGSVRPDRGHIHLSVDGEVVAMAYGLRDIIPALPPGEHTVQADFVATDHAEFSNRVVAAVTFTVE